MNTHAFPSQSAACGLAVPQSFRGCQSQRAACARVIQLDCSQSLRPFAPLLWWWAGRSLQVPGAPIRKVVQQDIVETEDVRQVYKGRASDGVRKTDADVCPSGAHVADLMCVSNQTCRRQ